MISNFSEYKSLNKFIFFTGIVISSFSILFMLLDIARDFQSNRPFNHLLPDFLITLSLIFSFSIIFNNFNNKNYFISQKVTNSLSKDISSNELIENQFKTWCLTDAEKKVAHYILVGISYSGIADLLDKSERTVRQQAIAIYKKSGLKNRSNFTGMFIELTF